jgi:PPM family protein phosphatase
VTLRLDIGAATDVGKVRDHNEDGYIVDENLSLVAVADGMGGHRGGEVASAVALDAFHAAFMDTGGLRDAVLAANDAVLDRASDEQDLRGMGTTLTAGVLGEDGTMLMAHVGDSRAYLARGGELARLTTDHSLVEELMLAGELTAEEAERDPRRSQITRHIGMERDLEVDMYPTPLEPGDRLVICSDGLNTMLSDGEVAEIVCGGGDPGKVAKQLVDAANKAGGLDNITVVVIDIVDDDSSESSEPKPKRRRRFLRRRK